LSVALSVKEGSWIIFFAQAYRIGVLGNFKR